MKHAKNNQINSNKTKQTKSSNGITLIALVITIIVLLILAGVTIGTLAGDNGIIKKANEAKNQVTKANFEEEVKLIIQEVQIEKMVTNKDTKEVLKECFQKRDQQVQVIETDTAYEIKYKNQNILLTNELEYIEIVEPQNPSDWEYTNEGRITGYKGNEENIIIPNYINGVRIKKIGIAPKGVFSENKKIKNVVISNGIEEIGVATFTKTNIKEITIPDTVTIIGSNAFELCSLLQNVVLGSNVKTIGAYSFFYCANLEGPINIPDSIEIIDFAAFQGCSKLQCELKEFPNLKSIKGSAFRSCSNITGSVYIPKEMTKIEACTFDGCTKLKGILVMPDTITSIGWLAFSDCGLKGSLKLPDKLEKIEDSAFSGCKNFTGDLIIPKETKKIGEYTFFGCAGFDGKLVLGDNVNTIGDNAFRDCSGFKSIVIPKNVTTIAKYQFLNWKNLENIYYTGTEEEWNKITIEEGNDSLKKAVIHFNISQ